MEYHMYLSNFKRTKVYELPILPEDMPDKTVDVDVKEFKTADKGTYAVIGKPGLRGMDLSLTLPGIGKKRTYYLSNTKGKQVIRLLKEALNNQEPIRLTIARGDGSCFINSNMAIVHYGYHEMRNTDFALTLQLKQWRKY